MATQQKLPATTFLPIGGMNFDLHPKLIQPNQILFGKNILTDYNQFATANGQSHNVAAITPLQSNVTYFNGTMPAGKNITIGSVENKVLNQVVWFVWNSGSQHTIWIYDAMARTYTKVFQSVSLPFDLFDRIGAADIVYIQKQDASDNTITFQRLLYWVSKNVFPAKINIDTAIAGGYASVPFMTTNTEFMELIKYLPFLPPVQNSTITNPDTAFLFNYVQNKQFQFRTLFYCDDGEITVCSPISSFLFFVDSNENFIQLQLWAGSGIVIKVQLLYRTSNTNDWRIYDTINRADIIADAIYQYSGVSNLFQYKFYNDRAGEIIDQALTDKIYDDVPLSAQAQDYTLGNLLMLGNCLKNFDNVPAAELAKPTVSIVYTKYAPLTLILTGSIGVAFSGGSPSDFITIDVNVLSAKTGAVTTIQTYTVHKSDSEPVVINTTINFIDDVSGTLDRGDKVFFEFDEAGGTAVVSLIGGGARTITGTYLNVPEPLQCGTGGFTIVGTTAQPYVQNSNLVFDVIVADSCNTWNTSLNIDTVPNSRSGIRNLKQNGRYGLGFRYADAAGRVSAVQAFKNGNIAIEPLMQLPGYQTNQITINFNDMVLPDDAVYVYLMRTKNRVVAEDITGLVGGIGWRQFVVNDVEFLKADFTDGNPNGSPPDVIANIKFSLANLLQFNTDYNFNTTVQYQFTQNDRIQFIRNAGGGWYDVATYGIIDLPLNGAVTGKVIDDMTTFLVPYDSRLHNLADGAMVELYTPAQEQQVEEYFEMGMPPLITTRDAGNNKIDVPSVVLNTFDTYPVFWSNRYVPDAVTDNGKEPFENASIYAATTVPSNGDDLGRVGIINPTEKKLWQRSLVAYSYPYVTGTLSNGLSTFDSERTKLYPDFYGGITVLYNIGITLLVIQEIESLRSVINRNIITLATGAQQQTSDVQTDAQVLSDPISIQGGFGCDDNNSFVVFEEKDIAVWANKRQAAICECDLTEFRTGLIYPGKEEVDDASKKAFVKSYFLNKLKYIYDYNLSNTTTQWLLSAGIDPKYNNYNLTFFLANNTGSATETYINNEYDVDIQANETIWYNVVSKVFAHMPAYTPEFYGSIRADRRGVSFITFKNGVPYLHNQDDITTYNNFYGVDTDQVFEIVLNTSPTELKTPLALDVQSDMLYYVDRILTNDDSVLSIIPPIRWKEEGQVFHAEILRDQNSTNGLYYGDVVRGFYVRIRFVRDNTVDFKLNQFDSAKRQAFNTLTNIIAKFLITERTGK